MLERAASYVADSAGFESPGSTVFRTAKYTSHEVTIDDEQLKWFEDIVESHPSADGWKIFVFTHAPPNFRGGGSGRGFSGESVNESLPHS